MIANASTAAGDEWDDEKRYEAAAGDDEVAAEERSICGCRHEDSEAIDGSPWNQRGIARSGLHQRIGALEEEMGRGR